MDARTRDQLALINRAFYEHSSADFSGTREHPWPGWRRVIDALGTRGAADALAVLDAGCGNGRFAAYLLEHWPGRFRYVGVDASEPLLADARRRLRGCADRADVRFEHGDLLATEAPLPTKAPLPTGPFDLIGLFGVLHHVPGFDARRALLTRLAERLAPGGSLAATFWQFARRVKTTRGTIPWSRYNETSADPIAPDRLDDGDHLLRFGAGDDAPARYCHLADADEIAELVARVAGDAPGLVVSERYRADGKSGELNEYVLFRRADG